jgi:hypothetical protein
MKQKHSNSSGQLFKDQQILPKNQKRMKKQGEQ